MSDIEVRRYPGPVLTLQFPPCTHKFCTQNPTLGRECQKLEQLFVSSSQRPSPLEETGDTSFLPWVDSHVPSFHFRLVSTQVNTTIQGYLRTLHMYVSRYKNACTYIRKCTVCTWCLTDCTVCTWWLTDCLLRYSSKSFCLLSSNCLWSSIRLFLMFSFSFLTCISWVAILCSCWHCRNIRLTSTSSRWLSWQARNKYICTGEYTNRYVRMYIQYAYTQVDTLIDPIQMNIRMYVRTYIKSTYIRKYSPTCSVSTLTGNPNQCTITYWQLSSTT